MAVYALEWCYQKLCESVRRIYKFNFLTWGVLVGVITCVGVGASVLGHKATCVLNLFFLPFFANFMHEFF